MRYEDLGINASNRRQRAARGTRPEKPGSDTPWGPADAVIEAAPGIVWVSTPGHGGYWLSPERLEEFNRAVPGFSTFAGGPWFEEDCDAAVVHLVFRSVAPKSETPAMYAQTVAIVAWMRDHGHPELADLVRRASADLMHRICNPATYAGH